MNPHYVLFQASSEALVFYSCDKDGNGLTDKLHWKGIKYTPKKLSGQKRKGKA